MAVYLKEFENHTQYESYINGSGAILPNVSICTTEGDVHYNPYVPETRVVAKFNVTDTSNTTAIFNNEYSNSFSAIEIDGVEQPSVETGHTFNTTGEHIVKYTLTNPTSIGRDTFVDCRSLTSIEIPDSVTSIGSSTFGWCTALTSIDIPDSVTNIGEYTFRNCISLTSITIPNGVTSIESGIFQGCTILTSIVIPNSVTSIGSNAFQNCSSLTSCTIGSGVTTIGNNAFNSCRGLTSIIIPNSVTSISSYAFQSCTGLTSIDIPSGVTDIGGSAFIYCSNIINVTINATTPPTLGSYAFYGNASGRKIYVPSERVNDYKSASGWSDYTEDIEPIQ